MCASKRRLHLICSGCVVCRVWCGAWRGWCWLCGWWCGQVESAALMVCLDHEGPSEVGVAGAGARARQMWHGDGMNRFYDKTLQFVVLPDGHAGFLGEHALADGAPTLRLCSEVASASRRSLASSTESSVAGLAALAAVGSGAGAQEIVWQGLEDVQGAVVEARKGFLVEVAEHQTARVAVAIGSDTIKKLGVGPDGFCQLALQVRKRALYHPQRRPTPREKRRIPHETRPIPYHSRRINRRSAAAAGFLPPAKPVPSDV